MPQAPGPLNFAPINNALTGIQNQRNQNALMEQRAEEFEAQQGMQQQRLAAEAANRNALMEFRRAEAERAQSNADRSFGLQQQQFGMQRQKFNMAQQDIARQREQAATIKFGNLAAHIRNQPPEVQGQLWGRVIAADPRLGERLRSQGIDPTDANAATQFMIAQASQFREPATAEGQKPPAGYQWANPERTALTAIPGGPATKLSDSAAARVAAIEQGLGELPQAYEILGLRPDPETGELPGIDLADRANIALGRGRAGKANRIIRQLVEQTLRANTGAAAPPAEVDFYMDIYGVNYDDKAATMVEKLNRVGSLMSRVRENMLQGRKPLNLRQSSAPAQNRSVNRRALKDMSTEELQEMRRSLAGG